MSEAYPHYDVVVLGGGPAGVGASIAAAKLGARTVLVESADMVGGMLTTGLPILGYCNSRGEEIVGGVCRDLVAYCKTHGGYVGCICDWRTVWGVCVHPDVLRLGVYHGMAEAQVTLLPKCTLFETKVVDGRIMQVTLMSKRGPMSLKGKFFIDATGDGDMCVLAGGAYDRGGADGQYQPVTMLFRMAGVDFGKFLTFVAEHPDEILIAENAVMGLDADACARKLAEAGYPYAALSPKGRLLGSAIKDGGMFPCTALFMTPTSMVMREVTVNATRIADVDAIDPLTVGRVSLQLSEQVEMCRAFLDKRVPGFSQAVLSGVSPYVGVRETRRIVGEDVLTTEHVLEGRKSRLGIAKGGHHVDVHGADTYQKRMPVHDGRSYDIPFPCLIPKELCNALLAGRCLSSTREANGSARVMGTCMATGEAAGTAAALCVTEGVEDTRQLDIGLLRETIHAQGGIIEGTH